MESIGCKRVAQAMDGEQKSSSNIFVVEMKKWFWDVTLNVIPKIIVGKGYAKYTENGDRVLKGAMDGDMLSGIFFDVSGKFVVSYKLPFLRLAGFWVELRTR